MKLCPHCGETYADFVDFCFGDGSVLTLEAVASIPEEPDSFDAPPPPKMLQGSQQRASYTRSATPVPRARRPGRSLIASGGADYTPPTVETAPPEPERSATPATAPVAPADPGMRYGDDDELVGDDAEAAFGPVDGFDEESWEQEAKSGYTPSASEVAISKADLAAARAAEVDEDADEESSGAAILAVAVLGFFAVVLVAAVAVFTLSTFFIENGEETDGVALVDPVAPQPVVVEPIEPSVPEPIEPEPVAPEPVEPTEPEPVEPEPIEPEPVEPEPIAQVPQPVVTPQPAVTPKPVVTGPKPVPVRPDPAPAGALVSVNFVSTPSAALLTVDGRAVATTPFNQKLTPGPHTIRITKDGFEPHEARVNVGEGTERYVATLKALAGTVAPQPVETPPPAPEPVAEPEPASVMAMVFAPPNPPAGVAQISVIQGGRRVALPAKISYPVDGATLVFELTNAEGEKWQSAVKCGPSTITGTVNTLRMGDACGPLKAGP